MIKVRDRLDEQIEDIQHGKDGSHYLTEPHGSDTILDVLILLLDSKVASLYLWEDSLFSHMRLHMSVCEDVSIYIYCVWWHVSPLLWNVQLLQVKKEVDQRKRIRSLETDTIINQCLIIKDGKKGYGEIIISSS